MRFVYLDFPNLEDFLDYVKAQGIHRLGKVLIQEIKPAKDGTPLVTYSSRLTAKDAHPDRNNPMYHAFLSWDIHDKRGNRESG